MSFCRKPDTLRDAILAGLCGWGYTQTQPLVAYGELQLLPALCGGIGFVLGMRVLPVGLVQCAAFLDWLSSHNPSGKEGTAEWGKFKDVKPELEKSQRGPFWGVLVDKPKAPLIIPFKSNAYTVAPSGEGKGRSTVVPTALANPNSKVMPDFKGGELACILNPALEQRGEIVRIIAPYGQFSDALGETDRFNPIDIIVDCFVLKGKLRDIPETTRGLVLQLYPEPATGDSDDTHWRDGGRDLIVLIIIIEVLLDGYDAELSAVALKLKDSVAFERDLRWILGIDLEGQPLAEGPLSFEAMEWASNHSAKDVADFTAYLRSEATATLELMSSAERKTFDSFASGARQKLARFTSGRLSPVLRNSTFRLSELKETKATYFPMGNPAHPEETGIFLGLFQYCCITAMKQHPNTHVPVYFIFDEATNYTIQDIVNLMTYGRGFGIICHFIFQAFDAFRKRYGDEAVKLQSECEIKQFLSGQREPDTLKMISEMLGQQSVMNAALSVKDKGKGLSENMSESSRPLYTPDEVRRTPYTILFVRKCKPFLTSAVSYSSITPWRKLVGINPFYGKPYLQKIKLRIRGWGKA